MAQDIFASSPEIDIRKRWATNQLMQGSDASPVHHPLQALARALQGAMGGYAAYSADQQDKATGEAFANSILGPQTTPQAAPQASAAAPMPPAVPPQVSAPGKIYSNDEPSPLDPPQGADRTRMIATILGESGNQGQRGQNAVASVIRNRAVNGGYGGDTPSGVVTAKNQFEPWNTAEGRARMAAAAADPKQAAAADRAIAMAYGEGGAAPNDPTGGAVNFISPTAQAALGRSTPAWAQGPGQDIGDHRFFGAPGQQPYQVAGPPTAAPGQGGLPPVQPQALPPVQPQGGLPPVQSGINPAAPNRSAVNIPPELQGPMRQMLSDPRQRAEAMKILTPFIKPVESFRAMSADEKKTWGVPEGMSAGIDTVTGKPIFSPPNTNVNLNTAQKGQEVMATESAKDFKDAQMAGREATKRSGTWDAMEQASKGFTPGATAEMKLSAKRYLKDLGIINGEDVPDAETFRQLQQQLAIHAQPKGQGAVSNFERDMYAKSIANMSMSPEALSRAIKIGRSLDDFDRKVAQVYRDNARKNGGVPNSIDINEEIDKLGSPLGAADMNYLRKNSEGKADTGATTTTAAPAGPDPAALAEAKKRGLIK
jgi:spore germination cell wall hydrolase CwlJ-like protein